jgi:hypothetical protein
MKTRIIALFVIVFMLSISLSGCTRSAREDSPGGNSPKAAPREISEMETRALEIMQQADLIPVVERTVQQGEEAKKMTELTFDETMLTEVLKREAETNSGGGGGDQQSLPKDTGEVWTKIKKAITELHDQWDRLEPQVAGEKISQEMIDNFEEDLDRLTASGTEQNRLGSLVAANQLTQHLAKFMVPFEDPPAPLAYELKYHVRNIVLNTAGGHYAAARESLAYIRDQQPALKKALEEKNSSSSAEELDISLNNLQRALDKQDFELIKINAAVVMENVVQAIEKLK